mmetsp:Transcript_100453/g.319095  ORF Transcript_100453/g.319095 Transcript_100453/m.319095 type:complete len:528 (-) Transcript_100453:7-1590(-)
MIRCLRRKSSSACIGCSRRCELLPHPGASALLQLPAVAIPVHLPRGEVSRALPAVGAPLTCRTSSCGLEGGLRNRGSGGLAALDGAVVADDQRRARQPLLRTATRRRRVAGAAPTRVSASIAAAAALASWLRRRPHGGSCGTPGAGAPCSQRRTACPPKGRPGCRGSHAGGAREDGARGPSVRATGPRGGSASAQPRPLFRRRGGGAGAWSAGGVRRPSGRTASAAGPGRGHHGGCARGRGGPPHGRNRPGTRLRRARGSRARGRRQPCGRARTEELPQLGATLLRRRGVPGRSAVAGPPLLGRQRCRWPMPQGATGPRGRLHGRAALPAARGAARSQGGRRCCDCRGRRRSGPRAQALLANVPQRGGSGDPRARALLARVPWRGGSGDPGPRLRRLPAPRGMARSRRWRREPGARHFWPRAAGLRGGRPPGWRRRGRPVEGPVGPEAASGQRARGPRNPRGRLAAGARAAAARWPRRPLALWLGDPAARSGAGRRTAAGPYRAATVAPEGPAELRHSGQATAEQRP